MKWLFDIGFLSLLAGLSIWAPAPATPALILFVILWIPGLVPTLARWMVPICLLLLSVPLQLHPSAGPAFWWALATAALLLLVGVQGALQDRKAGSPWSRVRKELFLTACVLIVASVLIGGAARALAVYRSTAGITPGRLDFLFLMLFWAGSWAGLDAGLREVSSENRIWNRRHALALAIAFAIILVRG